MHRDSIMITIPGLARRTMAVVGNETKWLVEYDIWQAW